MVDLLHAALEYSRRLPITLCPPTAKNPLGEGWTATSSGKAWQHKRWTAKEITEAFNLRGDLNVGCLWGPRSGIIDIEQDGPNDEQAFNELFEGEELKTPTFQSLRGLHRLFAWNPKLDEIEKATVHFKGLEIKIGAKGKGSHSLLPPSKSSSFTRQWLVSLDDCDPAPLPTVVIQQIEQLYLQRDRVYRETEAIASVSLSLCKGVPEAVQAAIAATIPTSAGYRHRQVFQFVRLLKAIPSLASADAKSLKPFAEQWYQQALPRIATKSFLETWTDFATAWQNVKFPAGKEPIRMLFEQALEHPMPAIAQPYDVVEVRRLIVLCRALQQTAGDKPFFLTCRMAGELLGISHVLANKWLRLLVIDDVLTLVSVGTQGKASRYRFRGD
jgi:hypothetical protein